MKSFKVRQKSIHQSRQTNSTQCWFVLPLDELTGTWGLLKILQVVEVTCQDSSDPIDKLGMWSHNQNIQPPDLFLHL